MLRAPLLEEEWGCSVAFTGGPLVGGFSKTFLDGIETALSRQPCRTASTFPTTPRDGSEPCWVRTSDLLIKSQLLYRLS